MTSKKFDPSKITSPDEFGFFTHPDIPGSEDDEGADWRAKLGAMGFQASLVEFEFDAEDCDVGAWFMPSDSATTNDMKAIIDRWSPTVPPGDGWVLVSKFDTESGPFALFVKPMQPAEAGGGK